MLVQATDQLEHEHGPALNGTKAAPLLQVCRFDQTELREGFLGRTTGVKQEAAEVWHRAPAAGLGNVGYDGKRGSDQLIATREPAWAAECLRERGGVSSDPTGNVYQ